MEGAEIDLQRQDLIDAARVFGVGEADVNRQTKPAGSGENDPSRTSLDDPPRNRS
jgi:hypothetical protein